MDSWALGVLLYTLVYGTMPFDGFDHKNLIRQISSGEYREPTQPSGAVPLEGQRSSGVVGCPAFAHTCCFCLNVCKESPVFPLQSFAFWQSWLDNAALPKPSQMEFLEQMLYTVGRLGVLLTRTWASPLPFGFSLSAVN